MSEQVFYSAVFPRPVRLSDKTRGFARRVLDGEFGNQIKATDHITLPAEVYTQLSQNQCYAECIWQIANQAPIRVDKDELFVGAATLNMSKAHCVPVIFEGMEDLRLGTVSHTTCGYDRVIRIGYSGLRKEVEESLEKYQDDAKKVDFLTACAKCLDAAKVWHERYLKALDELIDISAGETAEHYRCIKENLEKVPEKEPENFRQAVQALWFMFSFQRLCGNWPAIGRIDQILYPYLEKDLEKGEITLEEAREYVAHFWIKGCEWVSHETCLGNRAGSGDGQNYQNIVLSGMDVNGNDQTNAVTYLVLEVVEELGIADFPISVRLNKNQPREFLKTVARIMRYGGGVLAVYNDATVIDALVKYGYAPEEAVKFANDGCWEVQVPGRTCFDYFPMDMLGILHGRVLFLNDGKPSNLQYQSFDEIFEAFCREMTEGLKARMIPAMQPVPRKANEMVSPLISLFIDGCIAKGRDYHDDGAIYNVYSPHAGGLADVAGALQAIKYIVYDTKQLSLNEFMDIVKADWSGNEALRLLIKNHITYFGNGDKEADAMMQLVYDAFIDSVNSIENNTGRLFPAGISTFARQITEEFLDHRNANPDGHHRDDFLSNNINPTPGADRSGATCVVRSVAGLDLSRLPGGTAMTLRFLSKTLEGKEGLESLADFLYAFCELGGHFMQCDIANAQILREAQEHPEEYEDLTVRVSGWNARFNTLSKEWQEMIIQDSMGRG